MHPFEKRKVIPFLVSLGFFIGVAQKAQARVPATCLSNLRQIEGAACSRAAELQVGRTNSYSLADPALLQHLKGQRLPKCPQNGTYVTLADLDCNPPRCTLHGTLEDYDFDPPDPTKDALTCSVWRSSTVILGLLLALHLHAMRSTNARKPVVRTWLAVVSFLAFAHLWVWGVHAQTDMGPAVILVFATVGFILNLISESLDTASFAGVKLAVALLVAIPLTMLLAKGIFGPPPAAM